MPTPEMTPEAQKAYEVALRRIEACKRLGRNGLHLDLGGLGLTMVPPEIGQLTSLEALYLHNNQLNTLPPEIGQLTKLTLLVSTENQLRQLPPQIGQLTALVELYLHNNELSTLPPEIGQLTALTHLYLNYNQLNTLPPEIGQLAVVTELVLHHNQLSTLPYEIGRLTELRGLHINDNQISLLPLEVGQLTDLTRIYLNNNQLTTLPLKFGQLTALTELYLHNNQLSTLPLELLRLQSLKHLYLHGNPALGIPDSILGPTVEEVYEMDAQKSKEPARPSDILNYYFARQKGAAAGTLRAVNEIKVMLVGRGGAGKTSLRRFFKGLPHDPDEKETPGIALDDFTLDCGSQKIGVHLWDFAGQEITHALHHFFLTEGCVYLLVLDPRSNTEMKDALYWLGLLERYAGDSPVVLALNRQDARNGGYDLDRRMLNARFPTIAGYVPTNCETREGCDDLRAALCIAIQNLPKTQPPHQTVPAAWLAVKEECFQESRGRQSSSKNKEPAPKPRQHLLFEEFRRICSRHGEKDAGKQESLARLLHQLGAVLHFVDDPRLRDTAVLNPHWVTDAVYRLLRAREGDHSDGVLSLQDAQLTLPGETEQTVRYLLRLMERFEMCFPLDEESDKPATRWLVPAALGKYLPDGVGPEWQEPGAVRLRYVFDPLPEGVIPRFIVTTQRLSKGQPRWRHGVVLRDGPAAALVQRGEKENHLEISAFGPEAERLRLLEIIQGNLERINADVPKPEPYAEMELAGLPGIYRPVSDLEAAELGGQQVAVKTADGEALVQPTPQLNRATEPESRDPKRVPLSLFLSYSSKDKKAKEFFQENLTVMGMKKLITPWYDGLIEPDTLWLKEIKSRLESMDIFVGLLTNAFIASRFTEKVDVAAAKKKVEAEGREFLFVLILVNDISLDGLDLAAYHIMRPGGKAISLHKNREEGFSQAQKELEVLIKKRQETRKREAPHGREMMRQVAPKRPIEGVTYIVKGDLIQGTKHMHTDSHNITIHGNVSNSQIGQTLTSCTNMIQQQAPGEIKTTLTELEKAVQALLSKLPEDKQSETTKDWEVMVKESTSATPRRKWYSLSAEGLLEASKYVKDFTGNIAGIVGRLTKLLWPGS